MGTGWADADFKQIKDAGAHGSGGGPIEDDFAGAAGAHSLEAFFKLTIVQAVSDDGRNVEAGFEHHGHFVPRLIHLATIDAFDGEHVEDDLPPIDRHFFSRDAEHGDFGAVAHVGDHVAEGGGIARHFEADIETFLHAELFLRIGKSGGGRVDGEGGTHFTGQIETEGIQISDDDVAGGGMASDGDGHQADRTRAGDEYVFAQGGEGESSMDGVAQGIENGGDFAVDGGIVTPNVGHGQGDELGEGTGPIHADAAGVSAEVTASGQAVAAAATDDVTFSTDNFAGVEIIHVAADCGRFHLRIRGR